MNAKTYLAVGELAQAAAHQHGLTGPVEFTVCRPQPLKSQIRDLRFDADPDINSRPVEEEEFFYARHGF